MALNRLSLAIPAGGVFGVLGANGAGKTTFFRACLDLVRPTGGSLTVLGSRAGDASRLRRIGAMIEVPRYHPFLTAQETLAMLALVSGQRAPKIDYWLERVGLAEAARRKVHHFSVGMKQRLGLAAALIAEPELVILDEPTSGMDPAGIQEIRALLRELADKDGVTVVLSSHLLDEVQRVCDRVAIFSHGKVVAQERVDRLVAGGEKLRLLATSQAALLERLGAKAVADGDGALVNLARAQTPALLRALMQDGIELVEARWVGGGLEQFYLEQTGTAHAE